MVQENWFGSPDGCRRFGATLLLSVVWLLFFAVTDVAAELDREDHFTLLERLGNEAALDVLGMLSCPPGTTVYLVAEVGHPANWLFERILAIQLRERGCEVICSIDPNAGGQLILPVETIEAASSETGGAVQSEPYGGDRDDDADEGTDADADADEDADENEGEEEDEGAGVIEEVVPQQPTGPAAQKQQAEAAAKAATAETGAEYTYSLPAKGDVLMYRLIDFGITYPWAKRSWVIGPVNYGRIASARVRISKYREPGHIFIRDGHSDRVLLDDFPGWAKPYLEGNEFPFPIAAAPTPSIRRIVEPAIVGVLVAGLVYLFYENQK